MYAGEIVERGATARLFEQPEHPYTVGLLGAIPRLDRRSESLATIEGVVPNMADCRRAAASCRAALSRSKRAAWRGRRSPRSAPATGRAASARRCRGLCMTPLLEAEGLVKHFVVRRSLLGCRAPASKRSTKSISC